MSSKVHKEKLPPTVNCNECVRITYFRDHWARDEIICPYGKAPVGNLPHLQTNFVCNTLANIKKTDPNSVMINIESEPSPEYD